MNGIRHRHRCPRPDQEIRRPRGGAQPVHAGQARQHLRLSRSQRLRQDHHHPHAVRAAHARRRHRHLPRLRHPHRDRQDQDAGRLHDAALQPVSGPLGAREPGIHRPHLRHWRSRSPPRARRSSGSASAAARTRSPANCRAAGSSGWRSAPARCRARNCCCSTSRPPASIPRRGASSGTRSTRSPPTGSPCWSPPITWTRPSAVTRSPTSPMANCWCTAPSTR